MTPPSWYPSQPTAPRNGATAPLTGASGTVTGIKTKTKMINRQDKYILSKTKRLRAIRESWTGIWPFLEACWTIFSLAFADLVRRWRSL